MTVATCILYDKRLFCCPYATLLCLSLYIHKKNANNCQLKQLSRGKPSFYPAFMNYHVSKSHIDGYRLPFVVFVKSDLADHVKKRNKINGLRLKSAVFYTERKKKRNKINDLGEKGATLTTTQEKNYNKINDLRKIGATLTTTRDFYPHPYYYI